VVGWNPALFRIMRGRLNSILFTVLTVRLSIFIYATYYCREEKYFSYFFTVLLLFILSIVLLLLSNSIILIFTGWDLLGITSFFLVIFYRNWKRLNNSFITFLRNKIGDIIFLILFSYLIFSTKRRWLTPIAGIILLLLRTTKRAQFPFSSWLCAAIRAPTPIRALVHSSTLVTAGVIIILKFSSENIYFILFKVGLLTMFLRGWARINEIDFKKLVALSTLRQIGILFLTLGLYSFWLRRLHLIRHAFFKRLLFLLVGRYLHYSFSLQDNRGYSLASRIRVLVISLMNLSLFRLCALFFLRGFWRKDLIYETFLSSSRGIVSLFLFWRRLIFTLFYSFKMMKFTSHQRRVNSYKRISNSLTLRVLFLRVLSVVFRYVFINNFITIKLFVRNWEKYLLLSQLIFFFLFVKTLKERNFFTQKFLIDPITLLIARLLPRVFYEKTIFERFNRTLYSFFRNPLTLFQYGIIILFFIALL
jgi:NADH-ubiquinone oxidoreductase chain 5